MFRKYLLLALCFVSVAAFADTFNWSYNGTISGGGSTVNAFGTFTTDAFNGSFYQITGITGERNGVVITGLNNFGSADNELFLTGPTFDPLGLGYTAGGIQYNLYYLPGTGPYDEVHLLFNPFQQIDFDVLSVTISAAPPVPEPGSLLLLGSGLASVFGLVRRRARA